MISKAVIIIVVYNDYHNAINLIKNIKKFSSIDNIIIVDNGSKNGAYNILKEYEDEKLFLLKLPENLGVARANNLGLDFAKRIIKNIKYVIFSNADVEINENSIINCISYLEKDKTIGAICPLEMNKNGKIGTDFAWRFPTFAQLLISLCPILNKIYKKILNENLWFYSTKQIKTKGLFEADVIISCFIVFPIDFFESIGCFDQDTFLYHEEDIICWKIRKANKRCVVLLDDPIIHYGCGAVNTEFKKQEQKNRLLFDSSKVYLKKCLNVGKLKLLIYEIVFVLTTIERKMIYFIRGID